MVEPDKIRGYVGAYDPTQKPKESVSDPEKFKKVLKVEESTEAEKREGRKKKRSEHEGETEEELVGTAEPETPHVETSFTDVLTDKPLGESVLDGPTASKRTISLSDAETDMSYSHIDQGSGLLKTEYASTPSPEITSMPPANDTPLPPPSQQAAPLPSPEATTEQPSPQQPEPAPQQMQSTPPQQRTTEEPSQGVQQPTPFTLAKAPEEERKAPEKTSKSRGELPAATPHEARRRMQKPATKLATPLPPFLTEKKQNESFKEKKLREKFEKQTQSREESIEKKPKRPLGQQAPLQAQSPQKEKQPLPSESKIAPPSTTAQAPLQQPPPVKGKAPQSSNARASTLQASRSPSRKGEASPTTPFQSSIQDMPLSTSGGGSDSRRDRKHKETSELIDEIAASLHPELTLAHFPLPEIEPGQTASKLNPQLFAIFEKSISLITVQKLNGITRTNIVIDMKGSAFEGAELTLEKSDTAQDTFTISLSGSPEAVALFNANVTDLVAAFQQRKFDFKVNIKSASIAKRYAVQKTKKST